ncbi:MAG: type II/IV secretion system protein [Phycisphaera sp.]|nr:type II/IV secretion system protein [Phycisphaera sp.]
MGKIKVARYTEPTPPRRTIREDLMRVLMTDLSDLFSGKTGPVDDTTPIADGGDAGLSEELIVDTTRLAEDMIRDAVRERATDIHIDPQSVGSRIRLRVDGRVIDTAVLNEMQTHRLVNQVKTLADIDPVKTFAPEDARLTYELDGNLIDIRVTIVPCVTGEKIAIRLLDPQRVSSNITSLGLNHDAESELKDWLAGVSGLFLVTGPTGSGKTTLLYALLHEIRKHQRSIVTIEDPVEYQIDGITQVQVDTRHGLTFAQGLRTMLRLDPDYLMLGEVRDAESARSAIDASISGRALMSTMHARDAVSTLSALRNWGATDLEIAVSLSVVVAARLVRRLCENCRQECPVTDEQKKWLAAMGVPSPKKNFTSPGCPSCKNLGYLGRTGVFETWRLDESDYDLILTGVDEHSMRKHLARKKHRTLVHDAMDKVEAGITSLAELQSLGDVGGGGR